MRSSFNVSSETLSLKIFLSLTSNKLMSQATFWVHYYLAVFYWENHCPSVGLTDANIWWATGYKSRNENVREKSTLCLLPSPLALSSLKLCFHISGWWLRFSLHKLCKIKFWGPMQFLGKDKKKRQKPSGAGGARGTAQEQKETIIGLRLFSSSKSFISSTSFILTTLL